MAAAPPDAAPTRGAPSRLPPAGARTLTPAEMRDGVHLATGREHVLVVPVPRLVVEGPPRIAPPASSPTAIVAQRGAPTAKVLESEPGPKTLWITHPGAANTPTMPELVGFTARVTGVSPDPTPGLTFDWTLTIDYATLARADRRLTSEVVYTVTSRGGTLPADAFRRAPGTVTQGYVAKQRDARGKPTAVDDRAAVVAGGRLTIAVATTLPGVPGRLTARLPGYTVLAWDNPSAAAMRTYLATLTDATEAAWVADVFCAETNMLQFSQRTAGAYRRAFHPLANGGGDGGIGLGQLSHPDTTTQQETWDWRANARTALDIYRGTRRVADKYVAAVRAALADVGDDATVPIVRALAAYRRAAGLPALARVTVPDFSAQQLREDQARGYNGFRPSNDSRYQPQVGKHFHEFRLRTEVTPPPVVAAAGGPAGGPAAESAAADGAATAHVGAAGHAAAHGAQRLSVENERTEGGVRVADAVWVRVPDEERPRGPEIDHYIEHHVLRPNCP